MPYSRSQVLRSSGAGKLAAAAVKNYLFSLFERLGFHFDVPGKCCTTVGRPGGRSFGGVGYGGERAAGLLTYVQLWDGGVLIYNTLSLHRNTNCSWSPRCWRLGCPVRASAVRGARYQPVSPRSPRRGCWVAAWYCRLRIADSVAFVGPRSVIT